LTDGTPCWKDFTQSRNNRYSIKEYFSEKNTFFFRFLTAEAVSKNRIIGPSKILHFYNAPPDSTEDTFKQLYTELKVPVHTNIKFFSQGQPGQSMCPSLCHTKCRYLGGKSATGLMEWPDVESALEVYVIANHYTMHALCKLINQDVLSFITAFFLAGRAYTFKLAFSSNTSIDGPNIQH